MKIPTDNQQIFDAALRQLHADAIANVSARTQAQVHQRRRAALSGQSAGAARTGAARTPARRFGWPVAASFAAVLALAVGVQMRHDGATSSSVPALAVVDDGDIEGIATLDENPDFYLWLASNDAVALASE